MKITITHHGDQFNVALSSKPDADPFVTIYGCRVVDGSKGRFVGWPARKSDTGKWWSHVRSSEAFTAAVLAELDKAPKDTRTHGERRRPAIEDDAPPF